MNNTPSLPTKDSDDNELNLKQLFEQYAYYWKWFLISLVTCLFLAFVYLRYAQRVYNVNAKILLQDERQASGELSGLAELSNLTGVGGSSAAFVNDQIEVLRSRRLMRKVVDTNRLYFSYFVRGNIKSTELLEGQSPVKAILLEPDNPKLDSSRYSVSISKKGKNYQIKDELGGAREYHLGDSFETPVGPMKLIPQKSKVDWEDGALQVVYLPAERVVDGIRGGVEIVPNSQTQSFLVNFSLNYPLISKAELIINSLIEQYNQDVTYDKAQVTRATSSFINSRLELISKDLEEAHSEVAEYKDRNQLTDMEAEAQLYMQTATEND